MSVPDPIFQAIKAAVAARADHIAALADLDEDDEEQMQRANAAADRETAAWYALSDVTPTTMAGLCALVRYYADCFTRDETTSMAGDHFARLADVLGRCDGSIALSSLQRMAA